MKKTLLIAAAVLAASSFAATVSASPANVVSAAPAASLAAKSPKLANAADSLSYAFGTLYGEDIRNSGFNVDAAVFAAAMEDAFRQKSAMTPEEAQAFLHEYFSVRLPAENLRKAEAFLKITEKKHNVFKTDSGLLYEIINQGDMSVRAIDNEDTVTVNYTGTLADGSEFDSNDDVSFKLSGVIAGWTEGMKLIGKGGKIRLYLHPSLGYGERGHSGTIPANAALVFDVELLDVNPAE
jgi:FKBP-type peptidyl-prolyl cis-trans isomerase